MQGRRWKLSIQEFDFDIEHIPGQLNVLADAFSSLIPVEEMMDSKALCLLEEFTIRRDKYKVISAVHNSIAGHHCIERI